MFTKFKLPSSLLRPFWLPVISVLVFGINPGFTSCDKYYFIYKTNSGLNKALDLKNSDFTKTKLPLHWFSRFSICLDSLELKSYLDFYHPDSFYSVPKLQRTPSSQNQFLGKSQIQISEVSSQLNMDPLLSYVNLFGLFPGKGVKIAIIDAGFTLENHLSLKKIASSGQIIDQWNFVSQDTNIFTDSHGAQVLSVIAGQKTGLFEGLAPYCDLLLYVTEDADSEYHSEEDYLVAGIERAVENGADIISISLGYRYDFDVDSEFLYSELDGKTHLASLALLESYRRGTLSIVAAGNEEQLHGGNGSPTLTVPADADSILTIGAVNSQNQPCFFTSTGPSSDGRVKPEIAAPGCTVEVPNPNSESGFMNISGTSIATPIVTGFCAILKTLFPQISPYTLRKIVIESSSQFLAPDFSIGYGVPNAEIALQMLLELNNYPIYDEVKKPTISWQFVDQSWLLAFPLGSIDEVIIFNIDGGLIYQESIAPFLTQYRLPNRSIKISPNLILAKKKGKVLKTLPFHLQN